MDSYIIRTIESLSDITCDEYVEICHNWFGGSECPKTRFAVMYEESSGFLVKMECFEVNPCTRYYEDDEPVYKDSCMEFFADFYPDLNKGYVNFEINSKGAMLCMVGNSRENRIYAKSLASVMPTVKIALLTDRWTVELIIPNEFIFQIFGSSCFENGHVLRGNFYKCGDEIQSPHWGSWNWLGENPTDFHQPETFGELVLKC